MNSRAISIAADKETIRRARLEFIVRLAGISTVAASLLMSLASCSHDDDLPLPPLQEKTYTGANSLHLTYGGVDMPGKSVTFTPGEVDKAELKLFSTFDLSQLDIKEINGEIPAPGVIPGEISTTLPITLLAGNGFRSFGGTADTGKVSFAYAGKVYADSLVLDITDAKLANLNLAGTAWKLAPLKKSTEGLGYESLPFHIEWEADPMPGLDIPLSEILRLAVTVPCIPVYHDTAYSSVAQLLSQMLQTVAWLPNGNIVVTYVSTVGGAAHLTTLNATTLQYTVENPQYLKLYVNPLSVAGLALTSGVLTGMGETISENISPLLPMIKQLIGELAPQLAAGIPMAYTKTDTGLQVYFDQNLAIPLLTTVLRTVISDSGTMQALMAELQKYPEIAQQLPQIAQALQQLPSYLERSTRFAFGLNLIKYN